MTESTNLNTTLVKVTRCPTAYAAPSSATIPAEDVAAIRAHNAAIEARLEAAKGPVPLSFGKPSKRTWQHRVLKIKGRNDCMADVADELPDAYSASG